MDFGVNVSQSSLQLEALLASLMMLANRWKLMLFPVAVTCKTSGWPWTVFEWRSSINCYHVCVQQVINKITNMDSAGGQEESFPHRISADFYPCILHINTFFSPCFLHQSLHQVGHIWCLTVSTYF